MTELQDSPEQRKEERRKRREERWNKGCGPGHQGQFGIVHNKNSSALTGVFILLVGVAALLRIYLDGFPNWVFGWEMLMVAFGLFIGINHNFRGGAWMILILIGGIFLINRIIPGLSFGNIWPVALIVLGLFIILRPKHKRKRAGDKNSTEPSDPFLNEQTSYSEEDYVDNTSIFGGAKKIVISKNFKGGDLVNIFGGTELDLSQADFTGTAVIELTTIFGGTKLLVPSNWAVKPEAVTIFGGIEDKRRMQTITEATEKTLYIRGTVIFGGIEIKSF
jgi:predicted membrane protein